MLHKWKHVQNYNNIIFFRNLFIQTSYFTFHKHIIGKVWEIKQRLHYMDVITT
jgi:hypothetical protein